MEEYKEKDPIEHVLKILQTEYKTDEAILSEINDRVKAQVDECVKFAEESPLPNDDEIYKDVYSQQDYPFIVD